MKIDSVEALIRDDRWDDAQREIRKQLKASPGDHWLLTRLGLTYYEQHKYRTSLRFSEQALKITQVSAGHLGSRRYAANA